MLSLRRRQASSERPEANSSLKPLTDVFGEAYLALYILRFRVVSEGSIVITARYQNRRYEISDGRVKGLNGDLPAGIDVRSVRDQQRRIDGESRIEINHYAPLPVKTTAIDWSAGNADDFTLVINGFRQGEDVVGSQYAKIFHRTSLP